MDAIEVYFDLDGHSAGRRGCYRARLKGRHDIHDSGPTRRRAINNLLRTAQSHGLLTGGVVEVENLTR